MYSDINPAGVVKTKTVVIYSDYDFDTRLKIVRNVDGDIIFKIIGNGEMRIATSGGQFHGEDLVAVCNAINALINILTTDKAKATENR